MKELNQINPKQLTVIMAVLNTNPEDLKAAVSSATAMGCLEVICDDGSTHEGTMKALEVIRRWNGVEMVFHRENAGTSAGLSTAMENVSTPYVIKLDSDDRLIGLPQWEGDANPDAILTRLDPSGKWGDWETPTGLFEFIASPGPILNGLTLKTMVARKIYRPLPMDAADDITMGLMFFMLALANGWYIESCKEPIYHQRLDTGKKGDADWKVFPNARDRLHACAGQAFAVLGEDAPNAPMQNGIFQAIRASHAQDYPSGYPYPGYPQE